MFIAISRHVPNKQIKSIKVEDTGDNLYSIRFDFNEESMDDLTLLLRSEELHKLFWQINAALMHDEEFRTNED